MNKDPKSRRRETNMPEENKKNFIALDEEIVNDPHKAAARLTSAIKRRALIKAGLVALSFAALVGILIAATSYYFGGAYFWAGIIASLVVAAVLTVVVYRWKYRPSELEIAREMVHHKITPFRSGRIKTGGRSAR